MALIVEANEAAALFTHGLRITKGINYDYNDAAAAMSLLAIGAEKLLKLTIGLAHLDRGEPWPSLNYMRGFRHRVTAADAAAKAQLDLTRGTVPGHIGERRRAIEADQVIGVILQALALFGDQGRFHYLDSLGEHPPTQPAPSVIWTGMATNVMTAVAARPAPSDSDAAWKLQRTQVNEVIARSLLDWWEFYRAVWMTGVLGPLAKEFSSEVRLLRH